MKKKKQERGKRAEVSRLPVGRAGERGGRPPERHVAEDGRRRPRTKTGRRATRKNGRPERARDMPGVICSAPRSTGIVPAPTCAVALLAARKRAPTKAHLRTRREPERARLAQTRPGRADEQHDRKRAVGACGHKGNLSRHESAGASPGRQWRTCANRRRNNVWDNSQDARV